ncbi:hypothetical protein [Pseudodonghicola flavimaris]|uniref:CRISPR-associated protein Cse1 n=1 Tax=Pseudodonghicola flavimaris TaxID=3050036 RepID=A0ABT7EVW2_9RHOB|nr:hypothetical protein [Pseudodonghicola flavimaris]MDK3016470.1 hypothetical protein [Pseudodonghicola flavimaris]
MRYNVLTDPLIETDRGGHSLPGLMAALARGEVASFPALRPHQRPAWHMFLAQLGVLALSAADLAEIPETEDDWRAALRRLTPDFPEDAPWHLVVEDAGTPAFLQPPDPGGVKWSRVETPDLLDMVITSRNHDLKREIAHQATPQDWIFALVSLQTMEGFGGAGNYGIARMNGGSSSRAMIALAPAAQGGRVVDPSAWWRRDVTRLLAGRQGNGGAALLWCLPWPEKQALSLDRLDPLFIEVCRRVRLIEAPQGLAAIRATSKAARIEAKEARGVTGDPWAPVHLGETKTLTLGERNWSYDLLESLLYGGDWEMPVLAKAAPEEVTDPMLLIAEAFARGNSKTDGFKSRVIPVPKAAVRQMFTTRAVDLARGQVALISDVDKALRNGLALIAAEGDRDKLGRAQYARSQPARAMLQRVADAAFFPALWAKLEASGKAGIVAAQLDFARHLSRAARAEFLRAAPGIPCTGIMRPRAEVRGRQALEAGLARIFREMGEREAEHV